MSIIIVDVNCIAIKDTIAVQLNEIIKALRTKMVSIKLLDKTVLNNKFRIYIWLLWFSKYFCKASITKELIFFW